MLHLYEQAIVGRQAAEPILSRLVHGRLRRALVGDDRVRRIDLEIAPGDRDLGAGERLPGFGVGDEAEERTRALGERDPWTGERAKGGPRRNGQVGARRPVGGDVHERRAAPVLERIEHRAREAQRISSRVERIEAEAAAPVRGGDEGRLARGVDARRAHSRVHEWRGVHAVEDLPLDPAYPALCGERRGEADEECERDGRAHDRRV